MNVLRKHTIATSMLHVMILMVHSTALVILGSLEMELIVKVSLKYSHTPLLIEFLLPQPASKQDSRR